MYLKKKNLKTNIQFLNIWFFINFWSVNKKDIYNSFEGQWNYTFDIKILNILLSSSKILLKEKIY